MVELTLDKNNATMIISRKSKEELELKNDKVRIIHPGREMERISEILFST